MTETAALDERALRVSVDVFDGPLDLLLNLVKERQLDIATVPLATVADQYLAYIHAMEALDVELAADYLVVAATLVFLKSKALLPPIPIELAGEGEESAEAIEARLRERLIAYSKYRDVGQDLRARAAEASAYYLRPDGGDPTAELVQRYRIDAGKLAGALAAALRAAKPEKRTIVRERVSLNEQMDLVARAVRRAGRASFFGLCAGLDRLAIIVTFLAVLELVRRGRVRVAQAEAFEDIELLPPFEENHAA
ncbi:MAG: segregation/condensation protein A [Candidatus Eremiobacteraeota bacterium]|nr:segregation/condensation protein A [Candidatus Eremiobacteraeota bacterium]